VQEPGRIHHHAPVSVPAEVRSDYVAGCAMLKQRSTSRAAPCCSGDRRAPELTAAHIDLGHRYAGIGDLEHAEAACARR